MRSIVCQLDSAQFYVQGVNGDIWSCTWHDDGLENLVLLLHGNQKPNSMLMLLTNRHKGSHWLYHHAHIVGSETQELWEITFSDYRPDHLNQWYTAHPH